MADVFFTNVQGTIAVGVWGGYTSTIPVGESTGGGILRNDDFSIGLVRLADNYEVIYVGTPRDAWGVSAGSVVGWVDPVAGNPLEVSNNRYGVYHIAKNGDVVAGANNAFMSNFLNAGSNLLRVDQTYTFASENVVRIRYVITNVSGSSQAVRFLRYVDYDVDHSNGFPDVCTLDPLTATVDRSSFGSDGTGLSSQVTLEIVSPLVTFTWPGPAGGGSRPPSNAPAEVAEGLQLNLGTLANNASVTFDIFYAMSLTEAGTPVSQEVLLRSQVSAVGAIWMASGRGGTIADAAVLGYGPVGGPGPGGATGKSIASHYLQPRIHYVSIPAGGCPGFGGFPGAIN